MTTHFVRHVGYLVFTVHSLPRDLQRRRLTLFDLLLVRPRVERLLERTF